MLGSGSILAKEVRAGALMRNRLPSTMSLRAFEAVARHLSFTRAAIELNLTQTAVSHQVRNLEEMLGTKLFERSGHAIALSEVGLDYLQSVRAVLLELSAATDRAAERNDENTLTLQCLGTFALKRLVPILPLFRAKHPTISLRLTTVQSFQFHMSHEFDLAIWHGTGEWPGVAVDKLEDEEVFPVCSPGFLAKAGLRSPKDIVDHTIIRTKSLILSDEWPFWMDLAGLGQIKVTAELTTDYLFTSMQAAADGLGIALGRSSVVLGDLSEGLLVEPFSIRAPSNFAYYLVNPSRAAKRLKIQLFRAWLLEELCRRPEPS